MLNRFAGSTRPGSILGDAPKTSIRVLDPKAVREVECLAAVRLVGRAPSELDARDERVVVGEVRGDEPLESGERIERVQVEPAVTELAPERFDHRVGLDDIDLSDDVIGDGHELIVLMDDEVLGPAIGHDVDPGVLADRVADAMVVALPSDRGHDQASWTPALAPQA